MFPGLLQGRACCPCGHLRACAASLRTRVACDYHDTTTQHQQNNKSKTLRQSSRLWCATRRACGFAVILFFRFLAVVKKERLGSKGGGKALMMQSAPRLATDLAEGTAQHSVSKTGGRQGCTFEGIRGRPVWTRWAFVYCYTNYCL